MGKGHYYIEIRDNNGSRTMRWFDKLEEFYDFVLEMVNSDIVDEEEIMLVTVDNAVIYCALGREPLDWSELLGYLA